MNYKRRIKLRYSSLDQAEIGTGDLQTVGIGDGSPGRGVGLSPRRDRGVGLSRPGLAVGWFSPAGWVSPSSRGRGVGLLWAVVRCSGCTDLRKHRINRINHHHRRQAQATTESTTTTPARPSHHRINHHRASTENPKGRKSKERRESREKREQMRRRERNFRKK
uniref:Uncharacterized protein n=1 Tax=Fagus sylvatica TaxID=28930 RepID=A0A2N9F3K7_FAGSY